MECVLRETLRLIIMSVSASIDRETSKRYFCAIQGPCELALLVGLLWESVGEGAMPRKESKTRTLGKLVVTILKFFERMK